ncbi:hypothetical protein BOW53_07600 [Solemya pervernicosa gill symbiont]|uniref:Flagellar protein FliL n=2 Tax=Gammaproteobacteria incertae sedis TaxID=118884 RepID=A0A1T2L5U8_9GAMM|nr:flagellar basal body-associated FliL family protein [Candidatus Reidiella endopervernicosa]OOZ40432.1 hypothetical protein BOW53_07600 [Solemya pervernicosa gill symbiont]QKQ25344.1 flagellar basal body-associated FliL family protein [Candidatus Reidiella endopervernicosa]
MIDEREERGSAQPQSSSGVAVRLALKGGLLLLVVVALALLFLLGGFEGGSLMEKFKWGEDKREDSATVQFAKHLVRPLDGETDAAAYRNIAGLNQVDKHVGTARVAIAPVTVNVDEQGEHYLTVTVIVTAKDASQRKLIKRHRPAIQSAVMMLLTDFVKRHAIEDHISEQDQETFRVEALSAVKRQLIKTAGSTLVAEIEISRLELY